MSPCTHPGPLPAAGIAFRVLPHPGAALTWFLQSYWGLGKAFEFRSMGQLQGHGACAPNTSQICSGPGKEMTVTVEISCPKAPGLQWQLQSLGPASSRAAQGLFQSSEVM